MSGVVKDANGPVYNAIVQIGGASSKSAIVTGADGKYSLVVGAGSQEVYADAYGHAGKVETIDVSADVTKDITLDKLVTDLTVVEASGLSQAQKENTYQNARAFLDDRGMTVGTYVSGRTTRPLSEMTDRWPLPAVPIAQMPSTAK